jgi:uncharacterized membrane protein YeaQ/YmgE (transglycosylase-associated protein family)
MLTWILLGAVAGWLAGFLTGSDDSKGCITNIVIGMIGSIVGGFLASWYYTGSFRFTNAFTDFSLRNIVVSTIGAVVVLMIASFLKK